MPRFSHYETYFSRDPSDTKSDASWESGLPFLFAPMPGCDAVSSQVIFPFSPQSLSQSEDACCLANTPRYKTKPYAVAAATSSVRDPRSLSNSRIKPKHRQPVKSKQPGHQQTNNGITIRLYETHQMGLGIHDPSPCECTSSGCELSVAGTSFVATPSLSDFVS